MLKEFLPNEANRFLFPGFVAFCVAGLGVGLGFLSFYIEFRPLGILAFVITVAGVAGGSVFVAYRWWQIISGKAPRTNPK